MTNQPDFQSVEVIFALTLFYELDMHETTQIEGVATECKSEHITGWNLISAACCNEVWEKCWSHKTRKKKKKYTHVRIGKNSVRGIKASITTQWHYRQPRSVPPCILTTLMKACIYAHIRTRDRGGTRAQGKSEGGGRLKSFMDHHWPQFRISAPAFVMDEYSGVRQRKRRDVLENKPYRKAIIQWEKESNKNR